MPKKIVFGKPAFFFRAIQGEGDTVHYALWEVDTHTKLLEAKHWGTLYEGEHAIVWIHADMFDLDKILQMVARGLKEIGVLQDG